MGIKRDERSTERSNFVQKEIHACPSVNNVYADRQSVNDPEQCKNTLRVCGFKVFFSILLRCGFI